MPPVADRTFQIFRGIGPVFLNLFDKSDRAFEESVTNCAAKDYERSRSKSMNASKPQKGPRCMVVAAGFPFRRMPAPDQRTAHSSLRNIFCVDGTPGLLALQLMNKIYDARYKPCRHWTAWMNNFCPFYSKTCTVIGMRLA
jgi:hypothetical protein